MKKPSEDPVHLWRVAGLETLMGGVQRLDVWVCLSEEEEYRVWVDAAGRARVWSVENHWQRVPAEGLPTGANGEWTHDDARQLVVRYKLLGLGLG